MSFPLPDLPPNLIADFDFFNVEPIDGDLYAGWHDLHNGPDIFYTPLNGGHWVVTRAQDIYELYRDDVRLSHSGITFDRTPHPAGFIPGEVDPPDHSFYRTILNPEMAPKRVNAFKDRSRALLIDLIDGVKDDGGCDFYTAIAKRMPIYNFLNFVQLPIQDAEELLPAAEIIARDSDIDAFQTAIGTVVGYIDARIVERMRVPTDDFIGHMIAAKIDGRSMTPDELRATILNVMLGGLDTVSASMGFFMYFMAQHPSHRAQLIENPALVTDAVEELLRRHGIFNIGRLVKEPFEFRGQLLRKDDLILLSTALHNTDERRFPDPLSVDFQREDKNHLTFGVGIHRCLGSNFGRMQLKLLLQEWLARIPDFAVAPDKKPVIKSGRANSLVYLPLVW